MQRDECRHAGLAFACAAVRVAVKPPKRQKLLTRKNVSRVTCAKNQNAGYSSKSSDGSEFVRVLAVALSVPGQMTAVG